MNSNGNISNSLLSTAFLLCAVFSAKAAPVTLQVNMGAEIGRGTFYPDTDTVLVAGDAINNWSTTASPLTNSVTDTNVWLETFDVPGDTGATVLYKFLFNSAANGLVWEGNVGQGGAQNRSFTLSGSAQVLPVVYFNNVTNATAVTTPVTFQVDMSVQVSQGAFDPASGTVSVAGDAINNWNTTASMLTNSATATSIWIGTFPITEAAGSTVAYKFVMNGSTWEARANRTFTLSNAAQTLPVVYFNDVAGVATDIPLTFQVDMSVQTARGNFDPAADTMFAAGSFNGWSTSAFQLTNSLANTNLYTGTVVDSSDGPGATIQFKFVLNGSTWESIANRTYIISSTNHQAVPSVYFNDASNLGSLSLNPTPAGQVTLTWTAGPLVRLQSATNLTQAAWQNISNTEGQGSFSIAAGLGRMFFRLSGP